MKLKIQWLNPNVDSTEIRIYRSQSPIALDNLPEPYDIISGFTEEYIDEQAVRGTVYYYRVGSVKGEDEILTENINVKAVTFTGPGPQEIIAGDWELGFFGEIPQDDFITCNQLATWAGFDPLRANTYGAWFKVAYKGKILFISRGGILKEGASYNELYNAGLVYGTNDHGLVVPPGLTGVNQRRTLTISGRELIVRLPTGLATEHNTLPSLSASAMDRLASDPGSSEWDDIIRHFINHPFFEGDNNIPLFGNWWGLLAALNSNSQYYTGALCQQIPSMPDVVFARGLLRGLPTTGTNSSYPSNSLYRFCPGVVCQVNPSTINRLAAPLSFLSTNLTTATTVYSNWRPVLEYIE